MTFPKCTKCKKRYVYKQGDLCESCRFVPQVGKLPPGYDPKKSHSDKSPAKEPGRYAKRNDI